MIDSTYISMHAPVTSHIVPDWAQFLSDLDVPVVGEAAEERTHQEIALEMKLRQIAESRIDLMRMAKLLIEYGANTARLIPSAIASLNALGGFGLEDDSWSLCVSIPYTVDGHRLLSMIRKICGLDEWLWADLKNETPFTISGRSVTTNNAAFVLTGYGEEALNVLRDGIESLIAQNRHL